jgi:hypothetical protein
MCFWRSELFVLLPVHLCKAHECNTIRKTEKEGMQNKRGETVIEFEMYYTGIASRR